MVVASLILLFNEDIIQCIVGWQTQIPNTIMAMIIDSNYDYR
jgi:hypothetical protein